MIHLLFPFDFTIIALHWTGTLHVVPASKHVEPILHRNVFKNGHLDFIGLIRYSRCLYHLTMLRFTDGEILSGGTDRCTLPVLFDAVVAGLYWPEYPVSKDFKGLHQGSCNSNNPLFG